MQFGYKSKKNNQKSIFFKCSECWKFPAQNTGKNVGNWS